ncbi:conserved phage C-terminal domain-containing protein [Frederiksenia canicola]|uniref:Phage protein (TIGR02220 family) n=1 Tax=Frederiksenia canicola TaxID=123824 RepID=A0AAE6X6Q8_9PAST|nr:conserved phage C-terminal domain-containing protein [Frederiksenia canicola]QIM65241.1 hypothetical protein A4G17_07225 [Frederiksenia canicola]RPE96331.1 putative phage protein (TIGR02220 family) [Frederiksenia canicola]
MRYSIHINQVRCVEWGIKPSLGGIVDLINQASSWAEASVVNGFTYYWIEPSKVAEELIAEDWKRDTARRHMNTLKDKDIIDLVIMDGKYYVRLTEKGATWNQVTPIRQAEKNSSGENNSVEPRKKIREDAKKNSPDKYIQDQYNQDQNNPPSPPTGEPAPAEVVLNYLNVALANLAEQLGERKPVGYSLKPWAKNITARIAESSVADCLQVVDYLVAKWGRDEKMCEYLAPKTIFRQSNFADYFPKSTAWASNGKPICVNGKWVKPSEVAKRLITPTVEEAKDLFQKVLSSGGFGNPFKHLDFSQKRNVVLYHAVINTKNKRPLEREMLSVLAKEIGNAVENADRLNPPMFNSGAEK